MAAGIRNDAPARRVNLQGGLAIDWEAAMADRNLDHGHPGERDGPSTNVSELNAANRSPANRNPPEQDLIEHDRDDWIAARRNGLRERWRAMREKHAQSQTILGIAMAGIAALFLIGIVAAYMIASSSDPFGDLAAQLPAPPAASQPETTGAGGGGRETPPQTPQAQPAR
jgi:hypothetical protein